MGLAPYRQSSGTAALLRGRGAHLEMDSVGAGVACREPVARLAHWHPRLLEPAGYCVEIAARRQLDGEATKACRPGRRRTGPLPGPRVEPEVVMVAARGDETDSRHMAHHVEGGQVVGGGK